MALAQPAAVRRSPRTLAGLILAGLLGLFDMASLLAIPNLADSTEPGPPPEVLIADSVLGLITVAAVVWMFRTGSRTAARVICGSRILSALTALPAFFVPGVPAPFVLMAAAGVVLTVVCVYLVLARPR